MSERKMCKFYNLNVPDRRPGETPNQNNDNNDDDRNSDHPLEPYVPPHHHKLEYSYWMWFSRRPPARELSASTTGYGQALRMVGRIASVEQWWGLYLHLTRPAELPPLSDLHLFKLGIKPMWEDPANVNGGKWVVRLRKAQTGRAWEDLCMAMIGEQFMVGEEMCGIVLSIRFQEDHLAVWHRTAADADAKARVRDTLRRVLLLPASVPLEYKAHGDCLRASANHNPHNHNHQPHASHNPFLHNATDAHSSATNAHSSATNAYNSAPRAADERS
ncbi:eukaryotic translation initiation factor 4E type 2 isoform X2 [Maniola jurtina]|uniref:eukaryotic translation initiation factor 4E type 2 isoform X2 n=1 Tax=Maniola jurtina TaxID=191418 RepID=UPI001E68CA26|nr:eukaryotic translation initiation factor 4E type 2 isoform X2 [Maniola jurtina]